MTWERREILANGQVYHSLNRSIANEEIFTDKRALNRIIELLKFYKFPQKLSFSGHLHLPKKARNNYLTNYQKQRPIIEIYSYVIMPNHFHLLLKQLKDNGIRMFLANIQNGFAKYYNKKYSRNGSLFQKPFKAKRVTTDEIFLHVSRYIHLNPVTSYLVEYNNLSQYPWSSYHYYLNQNDTKFVNTTPILKIAGSKENYAKFVKNQVEYQRRLNKIKQYSLE